MEKCRVEVVWLAQRHLVKSQLAEHHLADM